MAEGIQLSYEMLVGQEEYRDENKQARLPHAVLKMIRDLALEAWKKG